MFHAMIVDDEKPAIELLSLFLKKTGQIYIEGTFTTAGDALAALPQLKIDVAFLDIEMPDMCGMALAEKILEADPSIEIIFVTGFDQYALKAFRINAMDYILKPFSPKDINKAITRLQKIRPLQQTPQTIEGSGHICCFGRLTVYAADYGEAIKWRTAKAEELFAFMLQNLNEEIPKWRILQILWPECEEEKQLNVNLYTTVYKIKKSLVAANIKFSFTNKNGNYKMELPEVYIDTAEFKQVTEGEMVITPASLARYKQAISLYKGNYLNENEYLWSQNEAEIYSTRYRRLVLELAKYYIYQADFSSAEQVLRDALAIIPLEDTLNESLLRLFYTKKDKAALIMHYNKIKELYQTELGITPNSAMQSLFYDALKL